MNKPTRLSRYWLFSILIATVTLLATTGEAARTTAPRFLSSAVAVKEVDGKVARHVYTDIARSQDASAPVIVLLNGLIYDIERWNGVSSQLAADGNTVVRLSFSAQPESLRLLSEGETPAFASAGLTLEDLAEDVVQALKHHRIRKSVTLVGLSYGSSVATTFAKQYPRRVKNLVLLSPLVVALDRYNPQGQTLRSYLDTVRFWENAPCLTYGWLNPWLCTSTDFWYDSFYNYFYENFLNVRVANTPEGIDPALYKKSVFHMVRATRDYDLRKEIVGLRNIHMVISGNEEANLKADQQEAWALIPKGQRRSLAEFTGVVHALPDEAPSATADWVNSIASGDESLQNGEEYIVTP